MPGLPVSTVSTWTTPAPPAPPPGIVMTGSPTVKACFMPVARITDHITPHGIPICPMCLNSKLNIIATGSPTVLADFLPVATVGSLCLCGHALTPLNVPEIPQTVLVPPPVA